MSFSHFFVTFSDARLAMADRIDLKTVLVNGWVFDASCSEDAFRKFWGKSVERPWFRMIFWQRGQGNKGILVRARRLGESFYHCATDPLVPIHHKRQFT